VVFDVFGDHSQNPRLRPRSVVEPTITASRLLLVICDIDESA
jgi:hypothetical protein